MIVIFTNFGYLVLKVYMIQFNELILYTFEVVLV